MNADPKGVNQYSFAHGLGDKVIHGASMARPGVRVEGHDGHFAYTVFGRTQ